MILAKILQWTWCLPQSLLGAAILAYFKARGMFLRKTEFETTNVYWVSAYYGVSLAAYIIVGNMMGPRTVKHEYGHVIQSYILGPLYLLVVGLPSFSMNLLSTLSFKRGGDFWRYYYQRWPESWADKLGGVQRSAPVRRK